MDKMLKTVCILLIFIGGLIWVGVNLQYVPYYTIPKPLLKTLKRVEPFYF